MQNAITYSLKAAHTPDNEAAPASDTLKEMEEGGRGAEAKLADFEKQLAAVQVRHLFPTLHMPQHTS